MIAFVVGLFVGGVLGFLLAALLVMSAQNDDGRTD